MTNDKDHDRFRELAEKWLNGTISAEEAKEYASWYNQDPGADLEVPASFAANREAHRERMLRGIKAKIREEDGQQAVPFYRRAWVRYAAAAMVMLAVGAYWFRQQSATKNTNEVTVANTVTDLQPGSHRATLTLSNGKTIILDDQQKGTVAQEGEVKVIKLDDGQLQYNSGNSSTSETVYNTISTPAGGEYHIILPDGSHVWMNAASSIRFPAVFNGPERRVVLTGEAYFEVASSKSLQTGAKMPFIVNAQGVDVTVLGTHFNIKAYGDEAYEATLLEGSVKVKSAIGNRPANVKRQTAKESQLAVVLKPGEQAAQADAHSPLTIHHSPDVEEVIAWKNGLFQFTEARLETIMKQIGRWYNAEIEFRGKVNGQHYSGKMSRYQNLSEILKILQLSGVDFTLEGKKIIVRS